MATKLKPTSQEARQIAEDAIEWQRINGSKFGWDRESYEGAKAAYLTRFDAPTAGEGERNEDNIMRCRIALQELYNYCKGHKAFKNMVKGEYLIEKAREALAEVTPAPQNAAGEGREAIDFAEWLSENTEIIREPKITLYRYCNNFNEWGNYILADIYTVFKEKYEPDAAGDNWISVETEKPTEKMNQKYSTWVWCWDSFGNKPVIGTYCYMDESWYDVMDMQFPCTHWKKIPLPSPPTATAEQDKK